MGVVVVSMTEGLQVIGQRRAGRVRYHATVPCYWSNRSVHWIGDVQHTTALPRTHTGR